MSFFLRLCWRSIFFLIFGLEAVICFYPSTRDGHQSRSIRFEATPFLDIGMSRVPTAALSNPSKQKILLFPITTSTFCLFMCSQRLMKVVLRCQNQDGSPQRLRTWRSKNHHCVCAAYSANPSIVTSICKRSSENTKTFSLVMENDFLDEQRLS